MQHEQQHYVNGSLGRSAGAGSARRDRSRPPRRRSRKIAVGGPKDVDRAVAAARAAFPAFSRTTRKQRLDLLRAILSEYNKRRQDIADALSQEMGAPLKFALERQSGTGTAHLTRMIEVLETYEFEEVAGHDADRARADRRLSA